MKDFRHNWISQGKRDNQPEIVSRAIGHSERTSTLHDTHYSRDQYRDVVYGVQARLHRVVNNVGIGANQGGPETPGSVSIRN